MKQLLFLFVFLIPVVLTAQKHKTPYSFTVAQDGSGNYRTVQEAINAVTDMNEKETVIFIKKGVYKEKLVLPASKINVTFIGEDEDKTILTYDDYASKIDSVTHKNLGTRNTGSFTIYGAGFHAENITFENSAGPVGQAVAVVVHGDRAKFINCRFLGFQDTLYTIGDSTLQYYRNCYIEGTVDFIFGAATALFENCTIHCKKGGYITAASTRQGKLFGYVFLHCNIGGDAPPDSYQLGRPWRPYAKTVFIECTLGNMIRPSGWFNWGKEENEKTAYYAEYRNKGEGACISGRVPWSHQLTDEERKQYTIANILNGWQP